MGEKIIRSRDGMGKKPERRKGRKPEEAEICKGLRFKKERIVKESAERGEKHQEPVRLRNSTRRKKKRK